MHLSSSSRLWSWLRFLTPVVIHVAHSPPPLADTAPGLPYIVDEEDARVVKEPPLLPPHLRHMTLNAVGGDLI